MPDLLASVLAVAARHGGDEGRLLLQGAFERATTAGERVRILPAITGAADDNVARAGWRWVLTSGKVARNDFVHAAAGLKTAGTTHNLAWTTFVADYDQLYALFSSTPKQIARFVEASAAPLYTEQDADTMASFAAAHVVAGTERTYAQKIEEIRARAARYAADSAKVHSFLASYAPGQPAKKARK